MNMKAMERPVGYLQDVPVALQRVHQRRVQRRHARTVGVLCHLVIYPSQLQEEKHPRKPEMDYSCKKTTVHKLKEVARRAHLV